MFFVILVLVLLIGLVCNTISPVSYDSYLYYERVPFPFLCVSPFLSFPTYHILTRMYKGY